MNHSSGHSFFLTQYSQLVSSEISSLLFSFPVMEAKQTDQKKEIAVMNGILRCSGMTENVNMFTGPHSIQYFCTRPSCCTPSI
mmetsp:Transcript_6075/g.8939  ORF Transcript_6075/g.8939 Transcript_6075/m.8939 type:complete len:83 (+) Transcript_6075:241-489(+)